jgi:hypothetical protein
VAVVELVAAQLAWSQSAGTILLNGEVLTVDGQFSTREVIAIRDGKIVALRSTAGRRNLVGPGARVIDQRPPLPPLSQVKHPLVPTTRAMAPWTIQLIRRI